MNKYLVSSKSFGKDFFNENNYLFKDMMSIDKRLKSALEFTPAQSIDLADKGWGMIYNIVSWNDQNIYKDWNSDYPLDMVIFKEEEETFWLPYIDFSYLKEAFHIAEKRYNSTDEFEVQVGHIGKSIESGGYSMWIEFRNIPS